MVDYKFLNFRNICSSGYLDLLKVYIKDHNILDYSFDLERTTEKEKLSIIEYFIKTRINIVVPYTYLIYFALINGHLDVVRYLLTGAKTIVCGNYTTKLLIDRGIFGNN